MSIYTVYREVDKERTDPLIMNLRATSAQVIERKIIDFQSTITLNEIPDNTHEVRVKNLETGEYLVRKDKKNAIGINEFYVDFVWGVVHFHVSQRGKEVEIEYYGMGLTLVPASRIYIPNRHGVFSGQTLQDIIDNNGGIQSPGVSDEYMPLVNGFAPIGHLPVLPRSNLNGTSDLIARVGHKHLASDIRQDSTHRFVTDSEKRKWDIAYSWGNHADVGYIKPNEDGKIDAKLLPDMRVGFSGVWDASGGRYPSGKLIAGQHWVISKAGEINGILHKAGDVIYYLGEQKWQRIEKDANAISRITTNKGTYVSDFTLTFEDVLPSTENNTGKVLTVDAFGGIEWLSFKTENSFQDINRLQLINREGADNVNIEFNLNGQTIRYFGIDTDGDFVVSDSSDLTMAGNKVATHTFVHDKIIDETPNILSKLKSDMLPDIDASKITSGKLSVYRIPELPYKPIDWEPSFENITNKPTTLKGYGITDAFTKTETTTKIDEAIGKIVGSAPEALDTLHELSRALGDDPNFATTVSTLIGEKVPKTRMINGYALNTDIILTPSDIGAEPSFTKKTAFNKDFGTVAGTVAEGNHDHNNLYYSKNEVDTLLGDKSDKNHNHNDLYEPKITVKGTAFNKNFGSIAGTVAEGNHNHDNVYSKIGHKHTWSDINGTPTTLSGYGITDTYTSEDIDDLLGGKADLEHSHTWNSITGKPSTFTPSSHSHSWDSITGKPSTFKPSSHNHDDRYYTESEIDTKLSEKSNTNHTHTWSSITGKPSTFTPSSHKHQSIEVIDVREIADENYNHDPLPKDVEVRAISAYFSQGFKGGSWRSAITVKGWTGENYAVWQLNGGASTSADNSLFFRSGIGDSWGEWYEVYHEGHKPDWNEIANRPTKLSQFTNDSNFITSSSLTWNNISGKPSSFPPSSHSHSWSQITEKPTTFPPSSHSHSWSQITGKPTTFPPTSHNHNEYMEVKLLWRGNASVSRSSSYATPLSLGSGNYVEDWDAFLIEWSSYDDGGSYNDNSKTRNISLVKVGSSLYIDSSLYNAIGGISFAYDTVTLGMTGCTVYGNQSYLYFNYSKQITFNSNGTTVFAKSDTYLMRIKRVWGVRMKDSRY